MIGGIATFHWFAGRFLGGVISDSAPAIVAPSNHVETRRHCSCFRRAWPAQRRAQQRTGYRVLAGWRLAQARIAESLLHLEQSRVTMEQYIALFSAVKDSLNDECLGYLHGRPLRCGSFALMARSTLEAKTRQSAERLSASFTLLQDDLSLAPVSDGLLNGAALDVRRAAGEHSDFLQGLLLRVFWRLLVWLHGGRLVPRGLDFTFETPPCAADYAQIFSGTLRFGQARSAIWFEASAFAQPMRRDTAALQTFLGRRTGQPDRPAPD